MTKLPFTPAIEIAAAAIAAEEPKNAMETIHRFSRFLFPISTSSKHLQNSNKLLFPTHPFPGLCKNQEHAFKSQSPEQKRAFHGNLINKRRPLSSSSTASAGWFLGLGEKNPILPEIVKAGDPVLHEPAREVGIDEIGSEKIEKIIQDMISVMRKAPGVGLAAPQIGYPLKVLISSSPDFSSFFSHIQYAVVLVVSFSIYSCLNALFTDSLETFKHMNE